MTRKTIRAAGFRPHAQRDRRRQWAIGCKVTDTRTGEVGTFQRWGTQGEHTIAYVRFGRQQRGLAAGYVVRKQAG